MEVHNEMGYAESLAIVVRAGLGATQISGIQDILESTARQFEAFGCVLWEASPGSTFTPDRREGSFFALAQWFENGRVWRKHDIPVDSATGYAIAHGLRSYAIEDILSNPHSHKDAFLTDNEISRACIVPLRFADGALGSLNLFRQSNKPPFTKSEEVRVRQIANLLPALYETVRDEVAYRCSLAVNELLQKAARAETTEQTLRNVTQEFCELLRANLGCFDVSVYLESEDKPERYVLYGTTLPDPSVTNLSYNMGDHHPAACALTYRRPIKILDLRQRRTFPPGMEVQDPNPKYLEYVEREIASEPGSPLSFMATPILAGERLLGVLRCCVPVLGPTYFANREVDLLMLLAGQIGHFVSDQRSRREVIRESQAYKVIIESMSPITDLVYAELKRKNPDEDRVLEKGLEAIAAALPGDQWIGIGVRIGSGMYRRRNMKSASKGEQPKDVVNLPAAWEKELTAGAGILKDRKQLAASETKSYAVSMPEIPNGVLIAPIKCRNEVWFLEIVNSGPTEFPKHAVAIAQLLGNQLGIYHDLLTTITELTHIQSELQEKIRREKQAANAHAQAMMDLEHQIRAPLRHARARLPGLLKLAAPTGSQPLIKQLQHLRGNMRRAGRVAGNARLFSRLASGQTIEFSPQNWSYAEIRQLLIEAAMSNFLISDEPRGVTFGFEEEGYLKLPQDGKVRLDKDLLDQAVNDLLDNAGKYSDPNTHVKIDVSLSRAYFGVGVTSKGLKIFPDQIQTIKERGERGVAARLSVGEGSGIGLWIADEIMKAHHGSLDITPTTPDRTTRIRLMFPIARI